MQRLLKHFEAGRDKPRALAGAVNQAYTAINRGRYTKQAYRMLKSWEDAEDAVQIAYARLIDHLDQGKVIKEFDNYFTISLRNAITTKFNERRGLPVSNSEDKIDKALSPVECLSPVDEAVLRDNRSIVDNVVKTFNPKYRDISRLLLDFHHTPEEISALLGIKPLIVYQFKDKLKKKVKELVDVGG